MEYLDILDEKGKKTGEVASKPEVHKLGLWHRAVHVWIVNSKNEILLQLRSANKDSYANMWDISAAGHVSSGEEAVPSALREIKEEIGLDISADKLEVLGELTQQAVLHNGTYINNEYNNIYLVLSDLDINQLKMQESEVQDIRWVSIPEFQKWIYENSGELVVPHPEEYKLLFNALEA